MIQSKQNKFQKLFLNCNEATFESSKSQYENISIYRKIRLWLHNKLCPPCEKYHEQNKFISKTLDKNLHNNITQLKTNEIDFIEKLKERLKKNLMTKFQ